MCSAGHGQLNDQAFFSAVEVDDVIKFDEKTFYYLLVHYRVSIIRPVSLVSDNCAIIVIYGKLVSFSCNDRLKVCV